MESFLDTYGLLNARPGDKPSENAFLFTQELILLNKKAGKPVRELTLAFKQSLDKCRVSPGVFLQTPSHADSEPTNPHDKYMSPDQLVAMMTFSILNGYTYHQEIYAEIERQGYIRYDNVNPDAPERFTKCLML